MVSGLSGMPVPSSDTANPAAAAQTLFWAAGAATTAVRTFEILGPAVRAALGPVNLVFSGLFGAAGAVAAEDKAGATAELAGTACGVGGAFLAGGATAPTGPAAFAAAAGAGVGGYHACKSAVLALSGEEGVNLKNPAHVAQMYRAMPPIPLVLLEQHDNPFPMYGGPQDTAGYLAFNLALSEREVAKAREALLADSQKELWEVLRAKRPNEVAAYEEAFHAGDPTQHAMAAELRRSAATIAEEPFFQDRLRREIADRFQHYQDMEALRAESRWALVRHLDAHPELDPLETGAYMADVGLKTLGLDPKDLESLEHAAQLYKEPFSYQDVDMAAAIETLAPYVAQGTIDHKPVLAARVSSAPAPH